MCEIAKVWRKLCLSKSLQLQADPGYRAISLCSPIIKIWLSDMKCTWVRCCKQLGFYVTTCCIYERERLCLMVIFLKLFSLSFHALLYILFPRCQHRTKFDFRKKKKKEGKGTLRWNLSSVTVLLFLIRLIPILALSLSFHILKCG